MPRLTTSERHTRPICNCWMCCKWRVENTDKASYPKQPGWKEWASPSFFYKVEPLTPETIKQAMAKGAADAREVIENLKQVFNGAPDTKLD